MNHWFYYVIIKWVIDMGFDELLKELDENLIVNKVEKSGGTLYIYCDIDHTVAKCKYCGMESSSVHSRYTRTVSDLPIQEYQVKLIITVPKYFCINEKCHHKTFAYILPFAEGNSLRTKRLDAHIYEMGIRNSSLETKKQLSKSHISVSNSTVLRLIKKKQNPSSTTGRKIYL